MLNTDLQNITSIEFDIPDSGDNFNTNEDGTIKSATFGKLIEKLTRPDADTNLLQQFLLTYRSICTPQQLMEVLMHRVIDSNNEEGKVIQIRCINVLKSWINKFWFDFQKDVSSIVPLFKGFVVNCQTITPHLAKMLISLEARLDQRLSEGDDGRGREIDLNEKPPVPILPQNVQGELKLTDIEPIEVARQLTLIEYNIWNNIAPWECLGQAWAKNGRLDKSPHICEMIERFNIVSNWVTTTICRETDLRQRVRLLERFIDIALELRKLNNFNAILEIVAGLNSSPVHRLKNTFSRLSKGKVSKLEELKVLVARTNNYSYARQVLHTCSPPCIPYLGMYLTDLTFIEEGHKDNTKDGLINWLKRHQISEVIEEINRYQTTPYNLVEVDPVISFLNELEYFDEETTYNCSMYIEPREGTSPGEKPYELLTYQEKKDMGLVDELTQFDVVYPEGYRFNTKDTSYSIRIKLQDGLKVITAGTLDKLVERITFEKYTDTNFLFAFLTTYRYFVSPRELLFLLEMRYNLPPLKNPNPALTDTYLAEKIKPVQLRVFNAIKSWIDKHFYDFEEDEELFAQLVDFIDGTMSQVNVTFANMLKKNIEKQQNKTPLPMTGTPPPQKGARVSKPAEDCTSMDFDAEEIARQITLIDHQLFQAIRPPELLDNIYENPETMGYAYNYHYLNSRIDRLAYIVNSEIYSASDPTKQAHFIIKWIGVMKHLTDMGNWHSAKGVVDGLDSTFNEESSVAWAPVPLDQRKFFAETKKYFDVNLGAHMLKEKINSCCSSPPCIPHFPIVLKDLENLEKVNGSQNKMINFQKYFDIYELINSRLINLQKIPFNFEVVPVIQTWLTLDLGPEPEYLEDVRDAPSSLPIIIFESEENIEEEEGTSSLQAEKTSFSETARANMPPKEDILPYLEEEEIRHELKHLIRLQVRKNLRNLRNQIIPPIDIASIVLNNFPGCTMRRWSHFDETGAVFGLPSDVEIDLIENNEVVYLTLVKQITSPVDILHMVRLGHYYGYLHPNDTLKSVIITKSCQEKARELADKYQVDILIAKHDNE
eukprot:TRINITY_DN8273_c0_g1_i1.p1 TRINITY_DN8273_c0_g1~~TRINITY_DN8273_c0_g1_i1.p1  ORF type:complete len:1053 (-),score=242.44 TRINITY_DN8273_c0_g1_i1:20-3178(-)